MKYLNELKWRKIKYLTPNERKILAILSNEKWIWRSRFILLSVTKLREQVLDQELFHLIQNNLVVSYYNKISDTVVYALKERSVR